MNKQVGSEAVTKQEGRRIKREIMALLDALRQRQFAYSFRLVGSQLRASGMPTARGWPPLLEKFSALSETNEKLPAYLRSLTAIYHGAVQYSTRAVSLYKVDPEHAAYIADHADELLDSGNPFVNDFPFPVARSVLARASYNGKFVDVQRTDDGVRITACAKRAIREREPISLEDMSEEVQEVLRSYDEIIGVKTGFTQAFDAVVVRPAQGRIEVHIDMCAPISTDDFRVFNSYYTRIIGNQFMAALGMRESILETINLFPFVQRFYDDKDGNVISLGHSTGTNSVKEERMRARKQDLREEPFHKEGLDAIGETESYAIKKGWGSPDGSHRPSIALPGHFSMAGTPGAAIHYAIFEQCSNQADYEMLVGKIS